MNRCAQKLVQHFSAASMGQLSVYCCIWGKNVGLLVSQSSLSAGHGAVPHFLMKTLLCVQVLLTDSGSGHVLSSFILKNMSRLCRREGSTCVRVGDSDKQKHFILFQHIRLPLRGRKVNFWPPSLELNYPSVIVYCSWSSLLTVTAATSHSCSGWKAFLLWFQSRKFNIVLINWNITGRTPFYMCVR